MSATETIVVVDRSITSVTVTRTAYGSVQIVQTWAPATGDRWCGEIPARREIVEVFTDDLPGLISALTRLTEGGEPR